MLGYGLTGGAFGGGNFQSRASGNPFVGNMTSGFMLPGNAPSSADTGQNAGMGNSPFETQVDGPFNGEQFGAPDGGTREPFTSAWRKQLASMSGRWFNKKGIKGKPPAAPADNMPPPMTGPLASNMQTAPMSPNSFSNPFMYF